MPAANLANSRIFQINLVKVVNKVGFGGSTAIKVLPSSIAKLKVVQTWARSKDSSIIPQNSCGKATCPNDFLEQYVIRFLMATLFGVSIRSLSGKLTVALQVLLSAIWLLTWKNPVSSLAEIQDITSNRLLNELFRIIFEKYDVFRSCLQYHQPVVTNDHRVERIRSSFPVWRRGSSADTPFKAVAEYAARNFVVPLSGFGQRQVAALLFTKCRIREHPSEQKHHNQNLCGYKHEFHVPGACRMLYNVGSLLYLQWTYVYLQGG